MDSRDERLYWSSDGQPHLRRYIVQATKAVLCVSGWFGIFALLLLYGPPAMSVADKIVSPLGIVTGAFAVLLSGGTATILTIILSLFVLAAVGWNRDQNDNQHDESETIEDESHV